MLTPISVFLAVNARPAASTAMVAAQRTFTARSVRPGRDRFSNAPASTTDELVTTLQRNATFRKNLAKHFQLPEGEVVGFVRDALVPSALTKDTTVMNYGVRKSGAVYGHQTRLKKGTWVWATRSGQPILKWECSNPLLKKPPVSRFRPRVTTPSPIAELHEASATSMTVASAEADFEARYRPTLLTPEAPESTPLTGSAFGKLASSGTASGLGNSALLLPLIPLLVLRNSGHGGQPNAVPEPGTLALVAMGGLALLRRRKNTH